MQPFKQSKTLQGTTVDSVMERLETLITEAKFSILHIHDVDATLKSKGLNLEPYRIVEFCRAPAAQRVLTADPDIGLFLPCKFLVYQKGTDVRVTIFLPTAISTFFPEATLGNLPDEVEQDILGILQNL